MTVVPPLSVALLSTVSLYAVLVTQGHLWPRNTKEEIPEINNLHFLEGVLFSVIPLCLTVM